jgi:hypothetical protein
MYNPFIRCSIEGSRMGWEMLKSEGYMLQRKDYNDVDNAQNAVNLPLFQDVIRGQLNSRIFSWYRNHGYAHIKNAQIRIRIPQMGGETFFYVFESNLSVNYIGVFHEYFRFTSRLYVFRLCMYMFNELDIRSVVFIYDYCSP